ncbi:choice-of-anchor A family protein [Streptomyces gamaensis]|uniref:Choice-of-anchor A family protein n=1 Tax=Streptomyces gamaensis TaxID=1763542 RepID=A0ABW0Z5C1_9ACTN
MRTSAVLATAGTVASLALVPVTPAAAAPGCGGNSLGEAGKYAEFVEGDATRYADTEGAVAVGGDARLGDSGSGQGFSVGSKLSGKDLAALPGGKSLVVDGKLTANQVVISQGAGVYGELKDASRPGGFAVDGPHAKGPSPVDFRKEFTALRASSKNWAAQQANGTLTRPEGGKAVLLTGKDEQLNVFTVQAADLQKASRISLKVPSGSTTLVNVLGSAYDMGAASLYGVEIWDPQTQKFVLDDYGAGSAKFKEVRSKLLWNFPQATSLKKNEASWPGTILAPDAAVKLGEKGDKGGSGSRPTGPGHVNGAVIAKELTSVPGAETHQMPFSGCLPGGGGGGSAAPAPEQPETPGKPAPSAPASGSGQSGKPQAPSGSSSTSSAAPSGNKPSEAPSGRTPSGSPAHAAGGDRVEGELASTGGGQSTALVPVALAVTAIGAACVSVAALRRRASRRH